MLFLKCLHGLAPDYLTSKFSERNTSYNLRDSENKLNVRLPCTNYFKNSFSYSGATLWNCLPYEATRADRIPQIVQTRNKQSSTDEARHSRKTAF